MVHNLYGPIQFSWLFLVFRGTAARQTPSQIRISLLFNLSQMNKFKSISNGEIENRLWYYDSHPTQFFAIEIFQSRKEIPRKTTWKTDYCDEIFCFGCYSSLNVCLNWSQFWTQPCLIPCKCNCLNFLVQLFTWKIQSIEGSSCWFPFHRSKWNSHLLLRR